MDRIKINIDRLGRDAQTIESCLKNMQTAMTQMQSAVSEAGSMWEGEGKQAFMKTWNNDMKRLDRILKNLSSINRFEKKAKKEYDKCEKKVSNVIAGL